MPRQVAILLFTLLIVWLWRGDVKSRPRFSKALWIPTVWLLLLSSRPLSWWTWFFFDIGYSGTSSDLDGSPMDRLFYSALILGAIILLVRRRFSLSALIANNRGLMLFYLFLLASVVWADFPLPTVKRWVKEVGAIPVLMLIFTEDEPLQAVKAVFSRCAYVVFTYSVLTIKYIPEIGRSYASHTGGAEVHGIAQQKNSLGEGVMVFGLILVWQLISLPRWKARELLKKPALPWVLTLLMGVWLLDQCDSKTSMLCFGVGTAILLTGRLSFFANKRSAVVGFCLVAVPLFFGADKLFHISEPLLAMLGRDPTLTNRTEIWKAVREHPVDPILGCGYLNYWDKIGPLELGGQEVDLKTAHNGYLEIFLDGGSLGVVALVLMLISCGMRHARAFLRDQPASAVGFAFFCMTLLNNVSETIFARRSPLWSAFLLFGCGSWLLAKGSLQTCSMPMGTAQHLASTEAPGGLIHAE